MDVLNGKKFEKPPVWLMRQAGRYLPEYREIRKQAGSFLEVCYNPELAIEVSIQPIRRFGFDASILFSDILVVPDALGREVRFVEGEGPRLEPIDAVEIAKLVEAYDRDAALAHLKPVLETVSGLRGELPKQTTLLGFCGAPWTVATYMIAGRGTPDQAPARLFSYSNPDAFARLLELLSDISADYLISQLKAGADAVQIFDSWAGVLGEKDFERWCIAPVKRLVDRVRKELPDAKIIGFPKGAGEFYSTYRQKTDVDALGLDWTVSNSLGRSLQKEGAVQGNLDPMKIIAGGKALDSGIDDILEAFGNGPHIFNLGHGITPQAPISHVEQLVKRIRG
ncbi:MAG: uroporphyrinogen decarboxylase [Rhizobiaceae bacterium]|nr:uroporphyrinogen decarboxylase [Rhizobiaceae bacterium]